MFRIGLSVYLMLVTLAGQSLCCCQLSRLSAPFTTWMRNDKTKAANSNHSCCRHGAPVKDSQRPAPSDGPSCPCQGTCAQTPALTLLEAEGARQLDRDQNAQVALLLDGVSLPTLVMPSADLILTSSTLSSPFVTEQDILFSLHILRC